MISCARFKINSSVSAIRPIFDALYGTYEAGDGHSLFVWGLETKNCFYDVRMRLKRERFGTRTGERLGYLVGGRFGDGNKAILA